MFDDIRYFAPQIACIFLSLVSVVSSIVVSLSRGGHVKKNMLYRGLYFFLSAAILCLHSLSVFIELWEVLIFLSILFFLKEHSINLRRVALRYSFYQIVGSSAILVYAIGLLVSGGIDDTGVVGVENGSLFTNLMLLFGFMLVLGMLPFIGWLEEFTSTASIANNLLVFGCLLNVSLFFLIKLFHGFNPLIYLGLLCVVINGIKVIFATKVKDIISRSMMMEFGIILILLSSKYVDINYIYLLVFNVILLKVSYMLIYDRIIHVAKTDDIYVISSLVRSGKLLVRSKALYVIVPFLSSIHLPFFVSFFAIWQLKYLFSFFIYMQLIAFIILTSIIYSRRLVLPFFLSAVSKINTVALRGARLSSLSKSTFNDDKFNSITPKFFVNMILVICTVCFVVSGIFAYFLVDSDDIFHQTVNVTFLSFVIFICSSFIINLHILEYGERFIRNAKFFLFCKVRVLFDKLYFILLSFENRFASGLKQIVSFFDYKDWPLFLNIFGDGGSLLLVTGFAILFFTLSLALLVLF